MSEAIVKGNEIILPKEIKFPSNRAQVIKIGEMLLIKPIERESLRGIIKGKFNRSAVELVRELRDGVERRA
jgi:virulence-associated protein VagC